jgi:hypothetical protein
VCVPVPLKEEGVAACCASAGAEQTPFRCFLRERSRHEDEAVLAPPPNFAERCGWDGPAPLGARQGLADF